MQGETSGSTGIPPRAEKAGAYKGFGDHSTSNSSTNGPVSPPNGETALVEAHHDVRRRRAGRIIPPRAAGWKSARSSDDITGR